MIHTSGGFRLIGYDNRFGAIWNPEAGALYPLWAHATLGTMRVIARSTLSKLVETLAGGKDKANVKRALDPWFSEMEHADWNSSQDLKLAYASASIIDADRVVFNIKGNSYRLVAAIDYRRQTIFIKWIGSYKEYDKIDVRMVQYGDQAYQKRSRPC
jgi:mRNA interferase HigB